MPFIGPDWRDPGKKWIRTDSGWRPLTDIGVQIVSHFRQLTSSKSSSKCGIVSPGPRCRSSPTHTHPLSHQLQAGVGRSKSAAEINTRTKSSQNETQGPKLPGSSSDSEEKWVKEREVHLKQLYFLLSMKSVPIGRRTSKENSRYSTISDAIHKMNFQQALTDKNCFPFICKVLIQIFESYYSSCSGSLQTALFKITDSAKSIAMETRLHEGLVLKMIEKAIATNEKLRHTQHSGYGLRHIDSKIKSLLKMKREVQESRMSQTCVDVGRTVGGAVGVATQLLDLPDDCLHHIISFLYMPWDVLNLGLTDVRLHCITQERRVWRTLTRYHYGQLAAASVVPFIQQLEVPVVPWSELFVQCYSDCGGKLREESTSAVCVCTSCSRMFWRSYGHPCCRSSTEPIITEPITPQKFMLFFT